MKTTKTPFGVQRKQESKAGKPVEEHRPMKTGSPKKKRQREVAMMLRGMRK